MLSSCFAAFKVMTSALLIIKFYRHPSYIKFMITTFMYQQSSKSYNVLQLSPCHHKKLVSRIILILLLVIQFYRYPPYKIVWLYIHISAIINIIHCAAIAPSHHKSLSLVIILMCPQWSLSNVPSDDFVIVQIHQHNKRCELCLISPMTHKLQFSAWNGLYTYRKWAHCTQVPAAKVSMSCPFPLHIFS